ncbi:MAG: undecaprenyl-diphosphate phosphatase [Patescibacteria group bacterium]
MRNEQVIILAAVQGLTEFLPVSSSGHLVILQNFFGLTKPPVLFDILLHVGTLGAIFFYFRKGLAQIMSGLAQKKKESVDILWVVFLGTIPAALIGWFFEREIELAFNSFQAVGLAFLFTAGLLFSSSLVKNKNRQFNQLKWLDALLVGLFQAVAILPGVSRSGSTIVSGLWRGLSSEAAFIFSFYLAIPAILGALVLKSGDLLVYSQTELIQGLGGMIIAGVVGFFALKILEKTLKGTKFFWFGVYCLVLGIIVLLV